MQPNTTRWTIGSIIEIVYLILNVGLLYYAWNIYSFIKETDSSDGGFVVMLIVLPLTPALLVALVVNPILLIRNVRRLSLPDSRIGSMLRIAIYTPTLLLALIGISTFAKDLF